jgi:hypothetical protein
MAVIGFQVVTRDGKPVSRRFAVRDAAQTLADLLNRDEGGGKRVRARRDRAGRAGL